MTSLPALAAFNNDVLSYVSCIQCCTGQKYKTCFSNNLLQHRRKRGSRVPRAATARCKCQIFCSVELQRCLSLPPAVRYRGRI